MNVVNVPFKWDYIIFYRLKKRIEFCPRIHIPPHRKNILLIKMLYNVLEDLIHLRQRVVSFEDTFHLKFVTFMNSYTAIRYNRF